MDIAKKSRTELKAYFVKNAIPTESNFADLIDAMLNQKEDGIAKPAGNPLCIEATGDASTLRKAINFYESFGDANPAWSLTLNPRTKVDDPSTAKPGFAVTDSTGANRLFIDRTSGNVGIGTIEPSHPFHVKTGEAVGLFESTGTQAYLRFATKEGMDNRVEITNRPGGKLTLWVAGGGDVFNIYRNGNIGIGNPNFTPQRNLHVEGWEIHSGGGVGGFSFANRNAPNNGAFTDAGPAGQRWVWYSQDSIARLWTNTHGDRLYIDAAGNVGFGKPPSFPFDVRAAGRIKLGLEGMGGGQLQIACNPNDNKIWLEAFNAAGNGHAAEFLLTGASGQPVPQISLVASKVVVTGALQALGGKGGYIMDQFVNAAGDTLEEGDVVVIASNQASLHYGDKDGIPIPEVDLTTRLLDTRVCGIVCSVHGNVEPSETAKSGKQARALTHEELKNTDQTKVQKGQVGWMVTLGAYAHCKVDADIAPIEVGDLLVTSPAKGRAQKLPDGGVEGAIGPFGFRVVDSSSSSFVQARALAVGAILGKALGSLKSGKGKIPILVTLH